MTMDPTETNGDHYTVIFENDSVRVLAYSDAPGDKTTPHEHPNSVMYTLGPFSRRLISGDQHRDVDMPGGVAVWLAAQEHSGENIGTTNTEVVFVELKDGSLGGRTAGALGPQSSSTGGGDAYGMGGDSHPRRAILVDPSRRTGRGDTSAQP